MRAAESAVLSADPAARVEAKCVRAHPIRITVIKQRRDASAQKVLFETDQRNLFKKNRERREQAMEEIEEAVANSTYFF